MGRSTNKKINIESEQLIDSSLSLLILPNELLEWIFSYLCSTDIIDSFLGINNDRIQGLIQTSLVHFNLASLIINEEQWIKTYFINQSPLCHWILSIRLTGRQMNILSKCNIQLVQLKSFHIINIPDNNVLHIDIVRMAPSLRSLIFDFLNDEMSHDCICCLARIVFSDRKTWQQQIESLSINNIHIPFGFNSLQLMSNLRHLIINIRYEKQLFDLCSYLPCIESFRVDVRGSSSFSSDCLLNPINISPYLKKLIISGRFSSHAILYRFILIYKLSLEYLTLMNIHHPDVIDGHQLQSELLKHLTSIIQFQFHFQFPVNIKEFSADRYEKTFDWARIIIHQKVDDDSMIIVVSSLPTLQQFHLQFQFQLSRSSEMDGKEAGNGRRIDAEI